MKNITKDVTFGNQILKQYGRRREKAVISGHRCQTWLPMVSLEPA
jgi:hypothetical protein